MFITIELPDAEDVKLKLEPEGKFLFSATSGPDKIPYEVELDLYFKADVNVGAVMIYRFSVIYSLQFALRSVPICSYDVCNLNACRKVRLVSTREISVIL